MGRKAIIVRGCAKHRRHCGWWPQHGLPRVAVEETYWMSLTGQALEKVARERAFTRVRPADDDQQAFGCCGQGTLPSWRDIWRGFAYHAATIASGRERVNAFASFMSEMSVLRLAYYAASPSIVASTSRSTTLPYSVRQSGTRLDTKVIATVPRQADPRHQVDLDQHARHAAERAFTGLQHLGELPGPLFKRIIDEQPTQDAPRLISLKV
jgi:hypothetical protein